MKKVNIIGFGKVEKSELECVYLATETQEEVFSVAITSNMREMMKLLIENRPTPIPTTHDLLENVLGKANFEMTLTSIDKVERGSIRAHVEYKLDGRPRASDCNVFDAIILSLKWQVPVFCAEKLLFRADVKFTNTQKQEVESERNLSSSTKLLSEMNLSELRRSLDEAILAENYERTKKIKVEIAKRE